MPSDDIFRGPHMVLHIGYDKYELNKEAYKNAKPVGKITARNCAICGFFLKEGDQKCPICQQDRVWFDKYDPPNPFYDLEQLAKLNHYRVLCPNCRSTNYFHLLGDLKLLQKLNSLQCHRCKGKLNDPPEQLPHHAYLFSCHYEHLIEEEVREEVQVFLDADFEDLLAGREPWPKCPQCEERMFFEYQFW